jgi:enoyl-CoA hydratase/carnithine racemase
MLSVRELAGGAAVLSGEPRQDPLAVVDLDTLSHSGADDIARAIGRLSGRTVVTIGVASTALGPSSTDLVTALTCTLAPGGAGRAWVAADAGALDRVATAVHASPLAALTLANLLPATAKASVEDGLLLESLAYSTLLAGPDFRAWRERTGRRPVPDTDEPVLLVRAGSTLRITLNRPERHNAFGRAVRDGLIEGLRLAELDQEITEIILTGAGRSYCSGGDLDEFGTAEDPASAHLTRLGASAGLELHRLRNLVRPRLHGACIGAGIEVPAFARHVVADGSAWFMLPELSMGLIPGAGGTVSLTHRIGRHRTAYLALTGDRIDVSTALDWGLVDAYA